MILRHLAQNLKEQNWTAIVIEFVLLVAGVFLGIQVANWNEERQLAGRERAYLHQLRLEIEENTQSYAEKHAFYAKVYASAERLRLFIEADEPCTDDCWPLLVDSFYASQWRDLQVNRAVFDEMIRLGMPRDPALRAMLEDYYVQFGAIDAVSRELPAYRQRTRSILPPPVQTYLWQACHRIDGAKEFLADDCPPPAGNSDHSQTVENLRKDPELHRALIFWMSNLALMQRGLAHQSMRAQAAIDSLDDAQRGTP